MKAVVGLENSKLLPLLTIPIVVFYGEHDWMRLDLEGTLRLKQMREDKG